MCIRRMYVYVCVYVCVCMHSSIPHWDNILIINHHHRVSSGVFCKVFYLCLLAKIVTRILFWLQIRHENIPPSTSPRTIGAKQRHHQSISPAATPPLAIHTTRSSSHGDTTDRQQHRPANVDNNNRIQAKSPDIIVPHIGNVIYLIVSV